MRKMPFNQTVKEKSRDEGYQDLQGSRCTISLRDLKEIYMYSEVEKVEEDLSEDDRNLLKKANLISRSVPRQSNRTKCREQSGHQPNMLSESCSSGVLYKNDLVCSTTVTDELLYFIVEKDTRLVDIASMLWYRCHRLPML